MINKNKSCMRFYEHDVLIKLMNNEICTFNKILEIDKHNTEKRNNCSFHSKLIIIGL